MSQVPKNQSKGTSPDVRLRHAFTVDVEDWHQGIPVAEEIKVSAEWRLERSLDRLLELLDDRSVRATFFWLGPAALRHAEALKRTADAGHEIGTHGWSHDLLYEMTPESFREETRRAAQEIEDIVGKSVTAYRAAYFSITRRSFWALEILAELGFHYDSSIFPIRNWRYGIRDFEPHPQAVTTGAGPILELPISIRRVQGMNIPVSGGAYFRLYPYWITRNNLLAAERADHPAVFYLHPWELDPGHPRVSFHWRAQLTHYANLGSTEPKLRRLLKDFSFGPIGEVLEEHVRPFRNPGGSQASP